MSISFNGVNSLVGTREFEPPKGPLCGGIIFDGPKTDNKPVQSPWVCEERPKMIDPETGEWVYVDEYEYEKRKNDPLISWLA